MKRFITLALCIIVLSLLLCGCSSRPSGKAARIYFVSGGYEENIEFKFINDNTVLLISEDGDKAYVPLNNIESIILEN